MAQYKVPQDVEADDKLLGPFTFRQFIYLIILSGLIALAWLLFQIFPLLAIIPLPIIIFFAILALPIKKDQPMETYLAAIVSYYLKPRKRFWIPGLPESTIRITAPKQIEAPRTRNISEEEAGRRLSFLADIVDSEGYAIKGASTTSMREEVYAEATTVTDIFDSSSATQIDEAIANESTLHHAELVEKMRHAIENVENLNTSGNPPPITHSFGSSTTTINTINTVANIPTDTTHTSAPNNDDNPESHHTLPPSTVDIVNLFNHPTVVQPIPVDKLQTTGATTTTDATIKPTQDTSHPEATSGTISQELVNLANNPDLSVETIAKEAHRIQQKQDDEIYISLH
jgi:hypothetical protein